MPGGRPGGFGGGGGYRPPIPSYGYRPSAPAYRPSQPPAWRSSRGFNPAGTPGPLRWAKAILRPQADYKGRPITGRVVQPVAGYGRKEVRYIKGKAVSVAPYKSPAAPRRQPVSGWRKARIVVAALLRLGHNVEESIPNVHHTDSMSPRQAVVAPVRRQEAPISGPPRRRR